MIKFYTHQPKISYLFYSDFDTEPHPCLQRSMQIDLRDLKVHYWDYEPHNPPILHCKETLVTPDYPLYEKFARLTSREQEWGLLDNLSAIAHKQDWLRWLEERCATFQGHNLRWRKDAHPYKVKLLKAEIKRRKAKALKQECND
ncbi:MAG: hypothetical protein F6K24_41760 [Okeania sp. SIO2D1]|nr:hypothetical protein [Okeania sp. SIO2D1]